MFSLAGVRGPRVRRVRCYNLESRKVTRESDSTIAARARGAVNPMLIGNLRKLRLGVHKRAAGLVSVPFAGAAGIGTRQRG